jgi:hypothetical protein
VFFAVIWLFELPMVCLHPENARRYLAGYFLDVVFYSFPALPCATVGFGIISCQC